MSTHAAGHPSKHSSWSALGTAAGTVLAVAVGMGLAEAWQDQPDNQPVPTIHDSQNP